MGLTLRRICPILIAVGLFSTPARAATVRADLDSDGRPDVATYQQHGTHADIRLSLSGRDTPVTLAVDGRILRLRLIDVTGDGRSDVLAEGTHGLRLWVNTGHGTLVRTHTADLDLGWPRLTSTGQAAGAPEPPDTADRDPGAATVPVSPGQVTAARPLHLAKTSQVAHSAPRLGSISRAPPAAR